MTKWVVRTKWLWNAPMTDFAYDRPIFLVPLSPSYPSSPVLIIIRSDHITLAYVFPMVIYPVPSWGYYLEKGYLQNKDFLPTNRPLWIDPVPTLFGPGAYNLHFWNPGSKGFHLMYCLLRLNDWKKSKYDFSTKISIFFPIFGTGYRF